ncbi:MAG: cyclase family protein [Promethearchaeota archaeon]
MKYVDLSIPITEDFACDPPLTRPRVEYFDHAHGAGEMAFAFPRLKPEDHLPGGWGWATEKLTLSTHSGTHMDAPWHYAPVQDRETGERRAMTIDEVPLEWCVGPLVVLDATGFPDGEVLGPSQLDELLEAIDHEISPGDVVCLHTSAAKYMGTGVEYLDHGVGVGREGTLHLVRRGVRVVGTDAWSWDAPFSVTAERWKRSLKAGQPETSIIWEGHFAGIERGYCQMEKLTNLDQVPPTGATIYCFPVKIARAGAGWVRAVAQVP